MINTHSLGRLFARIANRSHRHTIRRSSPKTGRTGKRLGQRARLLEHLEDRCLMAVGAPGWQDLDPCGAPDLGEPGSTAPIIEIRSSVGQTVRNIDELSICIDQPSAAPALDNPSSMPADGQQEIYSLLVSTTDPVFSLPKVAEIYHTLTEQYDVPADHITWLVVGGGIPAGYENQIDTVATKEGFLDALAEQGSRADGDDLLLVEVECHGSGYLGNSANNIRSIAYHGFCGTDIQLNQVGDGDEFDFAERDYEMSLYCGGGTLIGDFHASLDQWVYQWHSGYQSQTGYRKMYSSHYDNRYVSGVGTLSDQDEDIDLFTDYALGDTNRDGTIDTTAGETWDYDGDSVPCYDRLTGIADEDEWGPIDQYVNGIEYVPSPLPGYFYHLFDRGLDNKTDIDINPAIGGPYQVDGTDVDNDGCIEGIDFDSDGTMDDYVSIDETIALRDGQITDDQVAAVFNPIQCGTKIFLINTCYSGGFVNDLSGPRTIVLAGSPETEEAGAGLFPHLFNEALSVSASQADTDQNGRVSVLEAFNHASVHPNDNIVGGIDNYCADDNGDGVSQENLLPSGGDGALAAVTYFSQAIVSGTVFDDVDGDGAQDAGEAGLTGWTVQLDAGNDGQFDRSTTTDGDGNFAFANVPPGTYGLAEALAPGWCPSGPEADKRVITVTSGTDLGELDFANTLVTLDVDGNGRSDALTDGALILRYLADPDGQWSCTDAIAPNATRTTTAAISEFLGYGLTTVLDPDGDGSADAATDGRMILQYLFDPHGQWDVDTYLGSTATRTTLPEIQAYLDHYDQPGDPIGPLAENVSITAGDESLAVVPGAALSFDVNYTTTDADPRSSGLGLYLCYDSTRLTYDAETGLTNLFAGGLLRTQTPLDDTQDLDGDPTTDKYIFVAWEDISTARWPGAYQADPANPALPQRLYTANFFAAADASGSTAIHFAASTTSPRYGFVSTPLAVLINQAPVLDNTASVTLRAINEDDTTTAGTLVSEILTTAGENRITDPDPGAMQGIAVTAVDNAQGSWQYKIGEGEWSPFKSPTAATARLLPSDSSIRFVPHPDWNGTIANAITFRAWDQTSGTAGGIADTTLNGGATAFSIADQVAGITVNPVNDAPTFRAGPNQSVSDTIRHAIPRWATSISAGPADETSQTLRFVVTTNEPALFTELPAIHSDGTLTYRAAVSAQGKATITVQLKDLGGTENGGDDLSPVRTFAIVVATPAGAVDFPGLYAPGTSTFYLRNEQSCGDAQRMFVYGVVNQGWIELVGDWNGDGVDTPGMYDPATSTFYLSNRLAGGDADFQFVYGVGGLGWQPLVGDWDGDGFDTIALYEPATSLFFFKNTFAGGDADEAVQFGVGNLGWKPIAGDWDGLPGDGFGFYEPATSLFFLKNAHTSGPADEAFQFGVGNLGWVPLAGNWDTTPGDGVGFYVPKTGQFFLKNTHTPGPADTSFVYGIGGQGWRPLIGCWGDSVGDPVGWPSQAAMAAAAPVGRPSQAMEDRLPARSPTPDSPLPTHSCVAAATDQLNLAALAAEFPSLSDDDLDWLVGLHGESRGRICG